MLKLFIDTCVWRHWFSEQEGNPVGVEIQRQSQCFEEIYGLVNASSGQARFLYNQRIVDELGPRFKDAFVQKALPVSTKIPIPMTRRDGAYKADGSILHGGKMGGSLRSLLTFEGYDQDKHVKEAAQSLGPEEKLYETAPRIREFDIEHMESALEAGADFFITNDRKSILMLLERAVKKFRESEHIQHMYTITLTPETALPFVRNFLK